MSWGACAATSRLDTILLPVTVVVRAMLSVPLPCTRGVASIEIHCPPVSGPEPVSGGPNGGAGGARGERRGGCGQRDGRREQGDRPLRAPRRSGGGWTGLLGWDACLPPGKPSMHGDNAQRRTPVGRSNQGYPTSLRRGMHGA